MVKKVQKAKASSLKPSTSVKKRATKTKTEETISNGIEDKENVTVETENTEVVEDMNRDEVVENMDSADNTAAVESGDNMNTAPEAQDDENVQKDEKLSVKEDEPTETKGVTSDVKPASRPRKRKADTDATKSKETTTKTKTKKQKFVIEIPKISSVSGKVFVLGLNDVGQLGFEEDITEKKRPALLELPHSIVDIAAGGMHSVCLTESGEVITFGCNDEGALGRSTTEEGSEHTPQKVDIPERIVQVSAGDSHSAALSESGQVYIWGNFRNNNGPMGLVTDGAKQNTPIKILNNIKIVKISSGSDHLSCLSQEGAVYTCGNGQVGQLGRVSEHASVDGGRKGKALLLTPDKVPVTKSGKACIIDNIWTGSFATYLSIQTSGLIYAFGLNNHCQLGVVNRTTDGTPAIWKPKQITSFNSRSWTQINGGQHHTLALDNDGLVYSLGRSEYGRLGLGDDNEEKSVPTVIPSLEEEKCTDISSGNCQSFAVTENGSVFSWGMGDNFQLGHGNEEDQHTPRLIEGNFFNSWKAYKIAGGGQHTLILAHPRNSLEKSQ